MKKNRYLQVLVTSEQLERIKNKAVSRGYKTVSSYIRSIALEKDLVTEKRIEEIHRIIKKRWCSSPRSDQSLALSDQDTP